MYLQLILDLIINLLHYLADSLLITSEQAYLAVPFTLYALPNIYLP